MKKFLAIIAMMVTMLCGSIMLVSCSNNYKKMYLVVEYALPTEDKQVEWHRVDLEKGFDYTISDTMSSLYMRVKVEGTSKKVDSLYISQSVNSATFLQTSSVAPNETFEVKVKNTGSVRFTITPSQGGSDKVVSFGVNLYKQVTGISQNENCIPALVSGGNVELDKLTSLITYEPFGKTNQTGVDYVVSGVGTLKKDGSTSLLGRDFISAEYDSVAQEDLGENVISKFSKDNNVVELKRVGGSLLLTAYNTRADGYKLLKDENNVIELTASSIWNEKLGLEGENKIECKVYVYIVENIRDALLVSYNDNSDPDNKVRDDDGNIVPDYGTEASKKARMEVKDGDTVTLYNATSDLTVVNKDFSVARLYTYMNPSIYSFESNPGFKLNVYVNDEKYDYSVMPNNGLGIQINSITDNGELRGLKFAVNPNSLSAEDEYRVRMEVNFDAFDFSASDKNPEIYLNKEFTINVKSLASGFNVNGRTYQNNLTTLTKDNAPHIVELASVGSTEVVNAKLFTSYAGDGGMPLHVQAIPTDANATVYMGVYENYSTANGFSVSGNYIAGNKVRLVNGMGSVIAAENVKDYGLQFKIDTNEQKEPLYLSFESNVNVNVEKLFIVFRVLCTPEKFEEIKIQPAYITSVMQVRVVGAIDKIGIYKASGNVQFEDNELVKYDTEIEANIDFSATSMYVDLSEVKISSKDKKIKFLVNKKWVTELTADQLVAEKTGSGVRSKLIYKSETQCTDTIEITSSNGVNKSLTLKFVSVSASDNVGVAYDETFIWTSERVDDAKYKEVGTDIDKPIKLKYLALQSSRTAQFRAYGNGGKSENVQWAHANSLLTSSAEYERILNSENKSIYNINMHGFKSTAVGITNYSKYFDVNAGNVGSTAIVFVEVRFYSEETGSIQLHSKYFVFEIATYNPASGIQISEKNNKEDIIYINANYLEVSKLELEVDLLKKATQNLVFSSENVINDINCEYGVGNIKSIYGIKVDTSAVSDVNTTAGKNLLVVDKLLDGYVDLHTNPNLGANSSKPYFTVEAKDKLTGINSVPIKLVIVQFGEVKYVTEVTYVIKVGSYNPTSKIVIESGVQMYDNVYMSLMGLAEGQAVEAEIVAYATNANGDATYQELGYKINKFDGIKYKKYDGLDLTAVYDEPNNKFTLKASNNGGVYEFVIYAKDSELDANNEPKVAKRIKVTVSDGKNDETAYLIEDVKGFEAITNGTEKIYYKLSADIDLSKLSSTWWASERKFAGSLNGQMVIENLNPDSPFIMVRNYVLKNLTVSSVYTGYSAEDNIGLFNNITSGGTIKNVIFDNAKLQVVSGLNNNTVNAGIIAAVNNGVIENCSVMPAITYDNNATEDIDESVNIVINNSTVGIVNIGLIAGNNKGAIKYQAAANKSIYAHIIDCIDAKAMLKVVVKEASTQVNIGSIAGNNDNLIAGDYDSEAEMSVSELITTVANIDVKNESGVEVNVGGLVGNNEGEIKDITVTGEVDVIGAANIGGIVGKNIGKVTNVVNFGTDVTGNSVNANVGGIIGLNSNTIVDNVRVMFIAFESSEVAVTPANATISGYGNVGGIIGKTTVTLTLVRAYVENFMGDEYNITSSGVAAGLVASGTGTATLSFVNANISASDVANLEYFGDSITPGYVYFNGKANGTVKVLYYSNGLAVDESELTDLVQTEGVVTVDGTTYYIKWKSNQNVNGGYPYLVYSTVMNGPEYNTLTISPQQLIVNVDKDYFDVSDRYEVLSTYEEDEWETDWENYYKYIDGKYVRLTEDDIPAGETAPTFVPNTFYKEVSTYSEMGDGGLYMQYVYNENVVATAVVYYNEDGPNTHKLVSENGEVGLIEKTIIPTIAKGDYSVTIVEGGGTIATLTASDDEIVFSGVGRVVLRFVSIYDRSKADTVVIFVERPLDKDVFDVTTSSGLQDSDTEFEYSTRPETTSLLGVKLKGTTGKAFDSSKTYMTATVVDDTYLTIAGKTAAVKTGYMLGQFEVKTTKLPETFDSVEVEVKVRVYLDLSKFIGKDNVALSELMEDILLQERTITIVIYNKATNLTVPSNSNIKAESSVAIDISANLETGYVQNCSNIISGGIVSNIKTADDYYEIDRQYLIITSNKHDKVNYELTAVNENAKALAEKYGIWDLFDIIITHKRITDGYNYNLNLKLKDEFKYLDLKDQPNKEWRFAVKISANEGELEKTVEFAYVPQQLTSLRIENYSNLVAQTTDNDTIVVEFNSDESESSLIIPGESGLIKIFAEYNYSYFENIKISSTTQVIDGKTYFVKFQQMLYNRQTKRYQSYAGVTSEGTSLELTKKSYVDNKDGEDNEYDGTIFVRTILEKFAGERRPFVITVTADTYDINMNQIEVSREKTVISQYRPGVYINMSNALRDEHDGESVYLVEKGTQSTIIEVKVYGYEYRVEPRAAILKYNSITGKWEPTLDMSIALTKQGDAETDNTGATILKYLLSVSSTTNDAFKIQFTATLIDNGNDLTDYDETLTFYPVAFIPMSAKLEGIANNTLTVPVNTSKELKIKWGTAAEFVTSDKKNQINSALEGISILDMLYINYAGNRMYLTEFLSQGLEADTGKSFVIKNNGGRYFIKSQMVVQSPFKVNFALYYEYQYTATGVNVVFSINPTDHMLSYSFDLRLTLETSEDAPTPVYDVEGLQDLGDGENAILMKDITIDLDNGWTPIASKISSLDGNGKIITFKGSNLNVEVIESTTQAMNVGLLFNTIEEGTILKNIAIDISQLAKDEPNELYIKDDNILEAKINFGLLAGQNNGIVYNCEIISSTNKTLELVVGEKYDLTFGGLVGLNNGNITNSRVGTEYFERVNTIEVNENSGIYNTTSSIMRCYPIHLKSIGKMGGLAGENTTNGMISSSFVANTTIENKANIGDSTKTRTAGFVATNAGTIAYGYIKGVERTILETRLRTTEGMVYASGAGSVAGFVYYNSGTIHDSYSNIQCKSLSSAVAGFVYDTSSGVIYQCYSASKVESGDQSTLATELPFIGVGIDKENLQQLLSSENVSSCYYLKGDAEYDTNYKLDENDVVPKELSEQGFLNTSSLNNFAFIEQGSTEQQLNAVWTTSTAVDPNRSTFALSTTILPELTSANNIARSVRVLVAKGSATTLNQYTYADGYSIGQKNNPYIIRSVEEYQNVFVGDNKASFDGHVRFIDNIDFTATISEGTQYIDIQTRHNYRLGDMDSETLTTVDGNGMTISGILINHSEGEDYSSLGLFSEISYSVIKGLNLKYANTDEVGSSTATHVGGVAGIAHNTYFIDLNLEGNNVEFHAHNIVGGVVGKLTGTQSGLSNVSSNLSVKSGLAKSDYYYKQKVGITNKEIADTYLSYAGGIAGIIDIGTDSQTGYINKLSIDSANVTSARAGGIAGYIGNNIEAKRLSYYIGSSSQINGSQVVGGLIGENYANVRLSQVNSENLDIQFEYDQHFGTYINKAYDDGAGAINSIDKTDTAYGNLSAVVGGGIIGGFIGVNRGGDIVDSLTKANISHKTNRSSNGQNNVSYKWNENTTIGGFVGATYGGNYSYVYAQNYIELNYIGSNGVEYAGTVGGIVGKAYAESTSQTKFGMDNVVALNFFDKEEANRVTTMQTLDNGDPKVDPEGNILYTANQSVAYVVGDIVNAEDCLNSDKESSGKPVVNYGVFNASPADEDSYKDGKITKGEVQAAQSFNMHLLYGDESSVKKDIFELLFAAWDDTVWDKKYERYTPNLILDSSSDYYLIYDKDDIKLMEDDPDGNFILMADVPVEAANYVVFNDFKGTLFGTKIDDGGTTRYTRFIITLNPDIANNYGDGAGFFRRTESARIGNIGFRYKPVSLESKSSNKAYRVFGGVAAEDYDSRFEQIEVTWTAPADISAITTKDDTIDANDVTIGSIGSIVGNSLYSEILSCNSTLTYNLKAAIGARIGGLVGDIDGAKLDLATKKRLVDGLITSSKYTGKMDITASGGMFVGGIVANAAYTRISSSIVGSAGKPLEINISTASGTNDIGGIASNITTSSIGDCQAYVDISVTKPAGLSDNNTQQIGGIVADVINGLEGEDTIATSYAKLKISELTAVDAYVGGIAGNTGIQININATASEITMEENSLCDWMTMGGIVGINTGELDIKDSVAIMYIKPLYNNALIGGGILGQALYKYSLTNVASMGYIHANSTVAENNAGNHEPTLTILGGIVGLAGSRDKTTLRNEDDIDGIIQTSYAALTLSTAGVYRGKTGDKDHNIYTGGIVGYAYGAESIDISGGYVVYSSDYTLALEEHNVFKGNVINVTANILVSDASYFTSAEGWTRGSGIRSLPMPPNTANLLQGLGVWDIADDGVTHTFKENSEGKPYYPKDYNKRSLSEEYKYFILYKAEDFERNDDDVFNGVLLGNKVSLKASDTIFDEISKYSAVSNLNIELINDVAELKYNGNSSVAETNNGTIFMIALEYHDITIGANFAGIVTTNNGVVSNCHNTGIAYTSAADPADDEIAGLVRNNSVKAAIVDSYFIGIFSRSTQAVDPTAGIDIITNVGSSIVGINSGYIGNTYTAGQTSVVIGEINEDARHNNVFYDYYATFVYSGAGEDTNYYGLLDAKGVEGLETIEIQAVVSGTSQSTLFTLDPNITNTWKVYSMHNWDSIKNLEDTPVVTYNYGYPIKKIEQKYLVDGSIQDSTVSGKPTGNGEVKRLEATQVDDLVDENGGLLAPINGRIVMYADLLLDPNKNRVYDSSPFLINNLGVMSLINHIVAVEDDGGTLVSGTLGKYFELENNITMFTSTIGLTASDLMGSTYLTSGPKIGAADNNPFEGIFTAAPTDEDSHTSPRGLKYYQVDTYEGLGYNPDADDSSNKVIIEMTDLQHRKTISNLNGNALFANVGQNALIANLQLNNVESKDAPLISTVVATEGSVGARIYNIKIGAIRGHNDGNGKDNDKAGFVHTVNKDAILQILNTDQSNVIFTTNASTGTTSGVVALNYGTINVDSNSFERLNITIMNPKGTIKNIAGFVGTNDGTINMNVDSVVKLTVSPAMSGEISEVESISGFVKQNTGIINNPTVEVGEFKNASIGTFAGIVGTIKNANAAINRCKVKYNGGDLPIEAATFGGVAATIEAGSLGSDIDSVTIEGKINAISNVFGGAVAEANGGAIYTQVNLDAINVIGKRGEANAYGALVAQHIKTTTLDITLTKALPFTVMNGKNVGGIIGRASSGSFSFTSNALNNIITVKGVENVGGFIGLYEEAAGGLAFDDQGDSWPISGNAYATVGIAVDIENAPTSLSLSNFGGLVGCWKSTSAINEKYDITNANQVLNDEELFADNDDHRAIFKIKNPTEQFVKDFQVVNIGGVVGEYTYDATQTIAGKITNTTQVGVKLSSYPSNVENPIQGADKNGSLYGMYQLVNVGGIFGKTIEDLSTRTDIPCKSLRKLNLFNITNTANVYGMTAVGGLIGYAENGVSLTVKPENAGVQSASVTPAAGTKLAVIGVFDVGGLVGYAKLLYVGDSTKKAYEIKNMDVIGVANVGGLVGWAEDLHADNVKINLMKVNGNTRVGGVAGYIKYASLNNITIAGDVTIQGTIFKYAYNAVVNNHTMKACVAHYLPTDVGGVAGHIEQTHTIKGTYDVKNEEGITIGQGEKYTEDGTQIQAVKTAAKVYTDVEYKVHGAVDNSLVRVNMSTNFIVAPEPSIAKTLVAYYGIENNEKLAKYDGVVSGIGGFVGSLGALTEGSNTNYPVQGAKTIFATGNEVSGAVYAYYGINVGGIVGYIDGDPQIKLPSMNAAKVAGSLFVGGYIGKSKGFNMQLEEKNKFFGENKNSLTEISVQQYNDGSSDKTLTGHCVGGVIGYVQGNVYGLNLTGSTSKIKVYNSGSTNVGALVGRVDGAVEDCSIPLELCDAQECGPEEGYYYFATNYDGSLEGIIQTPGELNYGGLVGVLNVGVGKITVTGEHYYPFTVNNIQTTGFETKTSDYSYTKSEYNVLGMLAHYVSTQEIEISCSALTGLYDGIGKDENADKNPTNGGRGWAKEYTLFKLMTAVRQQETSVYQGVGDSYQTIYSAEYVNEVGVSSYESEEYSSNPVKNYKYNGDIAYTIYQPLGQIAKLYCAQGIATDAGTDRQDEYQKENAASGSIIGGVKYEVALNVGVDETTKKFTNIKQHFDVSSLPEDDLTGRVVDEKGNERTGVEKFNRASAMIALKLIRPYKDGVLLQNLKLGDNNDLWDLHFNLSDTTVKDNALAANKGTSGEVAANNIPEDATDTDASDKVDTRTGFNKYYTIGYSYISTDTLKTAFHSGSTDKYIDGYTHYFAFTSVFSESAPQYTIHTDIAINNDEVYTIYTAWQDANPSFVESGSGSLFTVNGKICKPTVTHDEGAVAILGYGERWGYNWLHMWSNWVNGGGFWGGVVNVIWAIGKVIYMVSGYWMTSLVGCNNYFGSTNVDINAAVFDLDNNAELDALYQTKIAGMRSITNMYDGLGMGEEAVEIGALSGIYAKQITRDGRTVLPTTDDIVMIPVQAYNDKDGKNKFGTKLIPAPYMSCGSENTIPSDYGKNVKIGSDYASDQTYADKYVPKYTKYNGELYLYAGSKEDMYKKLRPNYNTATKPTGLGEGDYLDIGGYLYIANICTSAPSVEAGNLITDPPDLADPKDGIEYYVETEYGIDPTVKQEVKFVMTAGSGGSDKLITKKSLDDSYWKQTSATGTLGNGYVTIEFGNWQDYNEAAPPTGFHAIAYRDAEGKISATQTPGTKVYSTSKEAGGTPITFTCVDSSGRLLTAENGGQFRHGDIKTQIGNYYLEYDVNNVGTIKCEVEYILYYPENDSSTTGYISMNVAEKIGQVPVTDYIGKLESDVINENIFTSGEYKYEITNGRVSNILKKTTLYMYEEDTKYPRFTYTNVPKPSVNNLDLGAYNKFVYYNSSDKTTLYTRYVYDSNNTFWAAKPITDDGGTNKTILNIINGTDNLVIAEGLRFTISNIKPKLPLQ